MAVIGDCGYWPCTSGRSVRLYTHECVVNSGTGLMGPCREKSTDLPPIETRTVQTQRENYVTIDTRILDQWGRLELTDQSPAEPVQGATQPKPASGPAEIPGLVEVELVQMARATTSQAVPPPVDNQGTTGSELSSDQVTQGGGHGKGKLIGKQPNRKG